MEIDVAEAFAEACRLLGEAMVKQSFMEKALARLSGAAQQQAERPPPPES